MEFLGAAAAYWTVAVWIVGALVITTGLITLVMRVINVWLKQAIRDYRSLGFNIWLYQAALAYEKTHPFKSKYRTLREPSDLLQRACRDVVDFAKESGYVVTIETQSLPFRKAMGAFDMVPQVRESRERYTGQIKD